MHGGVSTAKCLCEHAVMLHYAYIAYLVNWYFISSWQKSLISHLSNLETASTGQLAATQYDSKDFTLRQSLMV